MTTKLIEADRAFASGRLDEAARLCEAALLQDKDSFAALLLRGAILIKQRRFNDALPALLRAQELDQGTGKPALWLSRALRQLGRIEEAATEARQAAEASPNDPAAQYQLGMCLLEMGLAEEAATCFQRVVRLDPRSHQAHQGLGAALKALGRNTAAITALQRAAALAPPSPQLLEALFEASLDESDAKSAIAYAEALLRIQPSSGSHLRLARAQLLANDTENAEANLRAAESQGLGDGASLFAAASILLGLGAIEKAQSKLRESIDKSPNFGPSYSALAYLRKSAEIDRPLIGQMRDRLEGASAFDRCHLHYALGKSEEDLAEYESAMRDYNEANRLAKESNLAGRAFARALYERKIDETIEGLTSTAAKEASTSETPVLVIGMLRSGTTLAEQILSSHPEVGSAGEQGFWLHHREELDDPNLAAKYLVQLSHAGKDLPRIVDKMPDNYLLAPHLHRTFPKAKIIHVVRDPADACFSIYTTINRLALEWSHDLNDIAFVYGQYMKVMEAWQQLLPEGAMLEVRYEDLVRNREQVTRQMLAYCGLTWDPSTLHPEANQRAVTTPSAWQVRQP
ncbi:MAG TPA: sulfotransferase, partial [Fimbriimonas sp.]|nr:sulfotransferase [Fimbriimonas sp.]